MTVFIFSLPQGQLQSQGTKGLDTSYYMGEPLEEVLLQTDRDLYLAGESIWFSSFCGIRNEPGHSPISQILYVEIFNAAQKVFLREKFKLSDGNTSGYLIIPDETPTGYYFIRAYTMYLRNFPPENYFISGLTVVNPEIPLSRAYNNEEIRISAEHGKTADDISLALKVPFDIAQKTTSASLVDNNGERLDQLNIYPNGLCKIEYTPVDTIPYFLKLNFEDGDSLLTLIPGSIGSGISIQAEISESDLNINIFWPGYDQTGFANCKLKVLNQAYHKQYETGININQKISRHKVSVSELTSGFGYIALVDQNDSILGFKPYYIETQILENIQINLSKNSFKSRDKVELEIQLPQFAADEIALTTIAVVKKGTAIISEETLPELIIENPCLLKSYFEKNTVRTNNISEQINLAMMLYASSALELYRKQLNQPEPKGIYPPEIRDVSVSGYLLDKNTKEPIKDIQMFASVLFDDFQLHTTRTLDDGSFVFSLNHLTGKHNLYLFPDIRDKGEHELLIHNDFSTDYRNLVECIPHIDSVLINLLDEIYRNQQVSDNFPGGISVDHREVLKLSPWFGVEMITINLADYINLSSFREVINEIVPSVRLKENNNQYRFTLFDDKAQISYENPLVLLDHIPVTDINELIKIHPAQIEKIEVMNHPYILGDYTIWGLIVISTKTDNFGGIKLPEESAFLNYQTLQNTASFVPLEFCDKLRETTSLPFFSTLLYWDPSCNSDSNTKTISFYTSDDQGEFDVIVRGVKSNGDVYIGETTFSVSDK